jgi:hypothetical protein
MSSVPSDLCRTVVPDCCQAVLTEVILETRNREWDGSPVEKNTHYKILDRRYLVNSFINISV